MTQIDERLTELFARRADALRVAPDEQDMYRRVYGRRRRRLVSSCAAVAVVFGAAIAAGRTIGHGTTGFTSDPSVVTTAPSTRPWYGVTDERLGVWTTTQSPDQRQRQMVYRGRTPATLAWRLTVMTSDGSFPVPTTVSGATTPMRIGSHDAHGFADDGMLQASWTVGAGDVNVQLLAAGLDREALIAQAAKIDALDPTTAARLAPHDADFANGVPVPVEPGADVAVDNVRRVLESLDITVRGAERDSQLGTLVVAHLTTGDQLTVAIGHSGVERPFEEPHVIFDGDAGRTVVWWGPHGYNYELTVTGTVGVHRWTAAELVAIVRSFEGT